MIYLKYQKKIMEKLINIIFFIKSNFNNIFYDNLIKEIIIYQTKYTFKYIYFLIILIVFIHFTNLLIYNLMVNRNKLKDK